MTHACPTLGLCRSTCMMLLKSTIFKNDVHTLHVDVVSEHPNKVWHNVPIENSFYKVQVLKCLVPTMTLLKLIEDEETIFYVKEGSQNGVMKSNGCEPIGICTKDVYKTL